MAGKWWKVVHQAGALIPTAARVSLPRVLPAQELRKALFCLFTRSAHTAAARSTQSLRLRARATPPIPIMEHQGAPSGGRKLNKHFQIRIVILDYFCEDVSQWLGHYIMGQRSRVLVLGQLTTES
jgi:hypothetical protein